LSGLYLGPFTTAHGARWTLEAVRNLFPLRTCEHEMKPDSNARACFYLEIKRCAGPCVGAVSRDDYKSLCDDLVRALHDGNAPQIEKMRARMMRLAEEMRFEEAQQLKLQLEGIESVAMRLSRLRRMRDNHNVAIVQRAKNEENQPTCVSIFLVRGGLVRRHFARVTKSDWPNIRETMREIYTAPLPAKPFTAKNELDEMMILDRWLNAHGQEPCCVWLNDLSSRQWCAVATRKLQRWDAD
jgi:excinuclease ABC subunit C